jgi:hypothetical protein
MFVKGASRIKKWQTIMDELKCVPKWKGFSSTLSRFEYLDFAASLRASVSAPIGFVKLQNSGGWDVNLENVLTL